MKIRKPISTPTCYNGGITKHCFNECHKMWRKEIVMQ